MTIEHLLFHCLQDTATVTIADDHGNILYNAGPLAKLPAWTFLGRDLIDLDLGEENDIVITVEKGMMHAKDKWPRKGGKSNEKQ